MAEVRWIPIIESEPDFTDFVWIMSAEYGVALGYHYKGYEHKLDKRVECHIYQTAYTVGDAEGLSVEYYGATNCLKDDEWPTCPIEGALLEGYCGDGTVTEEMARRAGFNGDTRGRYCWMCPEVEWTEEWKAWVNANSP